MSYSTLILSLLFVLSSIPPSFCVYDDGCFRDQAPCTQPSMFPHAKAEDDCKSSVFAFNRTCSNCSNDCLEGCRTCIKDLVYETTTSCCPEGYCIPHGMECSGIPSRTIECCTDNGIHVTCNDKVCCNAGGTKCTSDDACCGTLNCTYDSYYGENVCKSCYPSGEACFIDHHTECCDPEYICVDSVCKKCSLTGEDCTSAGDCCYDDDKCITGKCCKSTTDEKCIVCASYLEACNDSRNDFDIPCCHDMRCAPNGFCYCGRTGADCTNNKACCDGYYCDTEKGNTCQLI